ncbi:CdaR family protein [Bacillus cytotoxicus]|uniref:CdaR family protein n=1 Tax=Bacillus cereus group sp. BfR-BA-01492 TaxID=2920361 RepID=UPI001F58D003|nr:CdaR family protein [Bacillus cereus group sp. BfR-BA-01492]EMA6345194.1 YbbR-like domain-containing protein [Bacillus cytotoxicus]
MDKLMENHWFLKGISLLLALMLFMSTTITEKNNTANISPFAGDTKETLTDCPIKVDYDTDKYIVTGIPSQVKVKLEGPKASVAAIKAKNKVEIPVDLRGYKKGTYEVPLKAVNIPSNVKATVQPSKIKVAIYNKAKKYVSVDMKLSNENQVQSGASIDKSALKPKPDTVEVVGTEEEIDSIASAKAYVDVKGINKTVTKEAEVMIYDKNGKRLYLKTSPSKVSVTVPVVAQTTENSSEKTVPLNYIKKGNVPEGLAVTNISLQPSEVTISGPKDVLDNIKTVEGVEVDLSKITESTTFDASVLLPKGVTSAKPNQVKVSVQIQAQKEQTKHKTIDGIPIQKNGLSNDMTVQTLSPQSGKISVDISGEASIVDKITAAQITAVINLQGLSSGTHNVSIQVSGPSNVSIHAKQTSAKVTLVKKEQPNKEVQGNIEQPNSQKENESEAEKPKEQDKETEQSNGTGKENTTEEPKEQDKGENSNG